VHPLLFMRVGFGLLRGSKLKQQQHRKNYGQIFHGMIWIKELIGLRAGDWLSAKANFDNIFGLMMNFVG
jgi:hypothetical protein